ncbi:PREDICTED: peroxisomal carnitine O-octanoyltransferase-like [Acropora digitifera]|uniref:peroxisomal carnitine O-octanoyltransferase-like n=1 Tax=Acropora digitifera TaxID=70779 RepID=UPI00077AC3E0|nr:PREDICTED: peroxisomal carnitine O-octanoyltransferase-like [Acropora digitifera]
MSRSFFVSLSLSVKLETWWEDAAYLSPRLPSAPFINFAGTIGLKDAWPVQHGTQIKRSALLTHAILYVWQKLYRQELPVDRMGSVPMCMYQSSRLFSCCKIPGKEKDYLRSTFVKAPHKSPRHIIVQTRGRIFCCTVLDENMEPLSPPEIEQQLKEIQSLADASGLGPSIGCLTGEERNIWYELRERLISLNRSNQRNLDVIETSLFSLVLDETSPVTDLEVLVESLTGGCRNRWFDKSLSILAFKSGMFGTNCDHAPFDAIVEINAISLACSHLIDNGEEWKGSKEIKKHFKPEELVFTVDDVICGAVGQAIEKYDKAASLIDIIVYQPNEYGKGFIKPFKIHPDTYVQMAIQLAYYKVHGKAAATYETSQTRQFYHGRTDTVRSCTVESTAWCKAMTENLTSVSQNCCRKLLWKLICWLYTPTILFWFLSVGFETPAIYVDKAWTASGGGANFVLSTSCLGFNPVIGVVAAMVTGGYGAFYSIEEDDINFNITTFKNSNATDGNKFKNALGESLRDIKNLLLSSKL